MLPLANTWELLGGVLCLPCGREISTGSSSIFFAMPFNCHTQDEPLLFVRAVSYMGCATERDFSMAC